MAERYLRSHFAPWECATGMHSAEEVFWGIEHFRDRALYGPALRRRDGAWWGALVRRCAREGFPSMHRRAITVRNTDMRVMPTHEPAFFDPREPGEGYPFDMFQNSALWANTPVLVSHASRDGAWYLVETAYAYGWVPVQDVALADGPFRRCFRTGAYVAILRDGTPVRDARGAVRFPSRVGMLFPVRERHGKGFLALAAAMDELFRAVPVEARIAEGDAEPFPVPMTGRKAAAVADALLGQPYGWGGLYHNRDCSALIRDYFTPFGLWLPRNSSQQAESGRAVTLAGMSPEEKERSIEEQGVPFYSMLWAPGHVMLYAGAPSGRALILHSMWGVATWDLLRGESRAVVGRSVITTLYPGAEMARGNVRTELIDRIERLVFPRGTGGFRCRPGRKEAGD
jgi:hypothetical protein